METVLTGAYLHSGAYGDVYYPSESYHQAIKHHLSEHGHEYSDHYVVKKLSRQITINRVYNEIYTQSFLSTHIDQGIVPILHWICLLKDNETGDLKCLNSWDSRAHDTLSDNHFTHRMGWDVEEDEEEKDLVDTADLITEDGEEDDDYGQDVGRYKIWVDPSLSPLELLKHCSFHPQRYECHGLLLTMPEYHGTLHDIEWTSLSWKIRIRYLMDILNVIQKMHLLGIVHCDLHTKNILYRGKDRKHLQFAIADFGLAHEVRKPNANGFKTTLDHDIRMFLDYIYYHVFYDVLGYAKPTDICRKIYNMSNQETVRAEDVIAKLKEWSSHM
jgi:serine/threonine protein kinase